MPFPLAIVEFLTLCVERTLDLFGCSIGVHTVEHCAHGYEFLRLTYKVPGEYGDFDQCQWSQASTHLAWTTAAEGAVCPESLEVREGLPSTANDC